MLPSCLAGFDDVVVHGANGVCGVPLTLASGAPAWTVLLALTAVVVTVVALRARHPSSSSSSPSFWAARGRTWIVLGVLALGAASSGWLAIARRGDAPQRMDAFAAREAQTLGEVERSTARTVTTGCVRSVSTSCAACEPMLHFSAPTRRACESDVAHHGEAAP